MPTPIYCLYIGKNNVASNLAWKELGEAESQKLYGKMMDALTAVGGHLVVNCHSAFANEETPFWGITYYPDLNARIEHVQRLKEIGWTDITDAFTLLGTAMMGPNEVALPDPIYSLWLIKNTPAGATNMTTMPKGVESLIWAKHNAIHEAYGSQHVITCDTYWSNEAYAFFGVHVYPDVEAALTISKELVELGWQRNMETMTILGKAW